MNRTKRRAGVAAIGTPAPGTFMIGALLVLTVIVVTISQAHEAAPPVPAAWSEVAVAPGSSLWDLAAHHPVQGLSTRETVDLIQRTNSIDTAVIMVGQIVRVPGAESSGVAVALR